jgi:hypothetical protein
MLNKFSPWVDMVLSLDESASCCVSLNDSAVFLNSFWSNVTPLKIPWFCTPKSTLNATTLLHFVGSEQLENKGLSEVLPNRKESVS